MSKSKRYTSIDLLKILSMLIIIQSHEDRLFPDGLQALSSGGAIGNALFFVISGFLMKTDGNGRDALKRLIRLYLPIYLMSVFNLLTGNLVIRRPVEILYYFVYPTDFTFLSTNLLCYLIVLSAVHLAGKGAAKKAVRTVLWISVLLDVLVYVLLMDTAVWTIEDDKIPGTWIDFKAIYSLTIFCIGILIRQDVGDRKENPGTGGKRVLSLFASLAALMLFLALKIALNRGVLPMRFQILTQLPVVLSAASILVLCLLLEPWLCRLSSRPARYLSDITLESYLVQFDLIGLAAAAGHLSFPANVLVTDLLILCAAGLFRFLDRKLIRLATAKL